MLRGTTFFRTDADLSEEFVENLRQASCYGWLQTRGDRLTGAIQGPRHHLNEAMSAIPDVDKATVWRSPAFAKLDIFPPIRTLTIAGAGAGVDFEADAIAVYLGLNRLGAIRGWAVDLRDPMASVRGAIYVDDKFAADFEADNLRLDVAKAGFGCGLNGLYVQLPDRWLDGASHRVAIEVPNRTILGRRIAQYTLPLAPPVEPRPWIAHTSVSRSEEVRQRVATQQPGWRVDLGGLLNELEPSACFRDWGVEEGFSRRGFKMPGMRDRMLDRYGQWFSDIGCSKGSACCKHRVEALSVQDAQADCPLWPRHFASKNFTKRYATSKGILTPRTYAITNCPEEALVTMGSRYVMKPENDSGRGLFIMHDGINLFDRALYSCGELRDALQKYRDDRGRRAFIFEELLVQEGLEEDAAVIPLDYKLHVFGGKVRVIHVDDRNTTQTRDPLFRQQGWYTRDWERAPIRMRAAEYQGHLFNPPNSYPEMLRLAEEIGTEAKGVYLRVDFYATPRGPVLGEITTFSFGGNGFTAAGDGVMSALMEIYEADLDA